MATPHPSSDGFNRRPRRFDGAQTTLSSVEWRRVEKRRSRVVRATFNVVGLGAVFAAPVAAISLWLLLTDAVLAGEVAERGSVFPVIKTLVFAVGHAIAAVLAYL
jgi:hypothetical protein